MGTVVPSGIAGILISNTAVNVLFQLQYSVLANKPKGLISPVPQLSEWIGPYVYSSCSRECQSHLLLDFDDSKKGYADTNDQ